MRALLLLVLLAGVVVWGVRGEPVDDLWSLAQTISAPVAEAINEAVREG